MGCGGSNDEAEVQVTVSEGGDAPARGANSFHCYFSMEGDSVSEPTYSVYDAGEMPANVMITCVAEFAEGDGSIVMFGGNNTDSYQAGYLITKIGNSIWFCVQMNANESDGPIMSEERDWNGVHDVVAQYAGGYARLYVDGECVAEGERNWVPADGGVVSLMSGSHNADEPKDNGPGCAWVSDLNICRNGGKRFRRFKKVLAKFDDYVDHPEKHVADAGEMSNGVIMACQAYVYEGVAGTMLHYGGNNEDSWQAGYILYWYPDNDGTFLWGIQMNANESDAPIQATGFGPGEYSICGTYKDGHAELWIDDELAGEQDCTWNMAEGGLLSLCSGSHQDGDEKDEAGPGMLAISNVYIALQ
jgi:hypothetical protein